MAKEIARGYVFDLEKAKRLPTAIIIPANQEVVVGSIVRLDGSSSFDPDGKPLTYAFSFESVPIGSQVEGEGFKLLDSDGSIVSFSPDVVGHYKIKLVVSNGSIESDPTIGEIDVRVILVPNNRGINPDASWLWNYLSDFWRLVEDKRKFEVFWESAIQLVAAELLTLYQTDYNKSIRDIQNVFQRRWLWYSPYLELDSSQTRFILADDQAGVEASTVTISPQTGQPAANQTTYSNQVSVPVSEGSFAETPFKLPIKVGRLLTVSKRTYTLSRASGLAKAILSNVDGQVFSNQPPFLGPQGVFTGTGFTASMVGFLLKINSGDNVGEYRISTFINSTLIFITKVNGDPPILTANSNVIYSVVPSKPTHSAFYADLDQVPTGQIQQTWRFSPTLVSDEHDFEAQGVAAGDLLEVEVTRLDNNLNAFFKVQVVGVDRNRLSFVYNLDDLVDGEPASGLSVVAQLALADGLQVSGLFIDVNGVLIHTDESLLIKETISSISFRRLFYETELTDSTEIDVGAFRVKLRPVRIIRNRAIPVDQKVVSIPGLQEYIKQPEVVKLEDGSLVQVTDTGTFPLARLPFNLVENLDYIIDDEAMISGACDLRAGSDLLFAPFADFVERSITEGDLITVIGGAFKQEFTVVKVIDGENIKVAPTPSVDLDAAQYSIERRVSGKYIRFVDGTFTKTSPAPKRFWAEITYLDNNDAVESNFGYLVGVRQSDLDRQNSFTPYRFSVAGLMYALTHAPRLSAMHLAAQIMTGLPFTVARGVIKEINPDFRKRVDGSTLLGRIVVEEKDKEDKSTGFHHIYFYPQGRQIKPPLTTGTQSKLIGSVPGPWPVAGLTMEVSLNNTPAVLITFTGTNPLEVDQVIYQINQFIPGLASESGVATKKVQLTSPFGPNSTVFVQGAAANALGLNIEDVEEEFIPATPDHAGLGINQNTGKEFAVGDTVERFVPLSKGVTVQEYISTPEWFRTFVEQGDVSAHLTKYHSFRLLANADIVSPQDVDLAARFLKGVSSRQPGAKNHYLRMQVGILRALEDYVVIEDILSFAFGTPPVFYENLHYSLPTAIKFDRSFIDSSFLTVEGEMFAKYIGGVDLITTQDSNIVESPGGGFINARAGLGESHDTPFLIPGDLLVIKTGMNVGRYRVSSVVSDTQLALTLTGINFMTANEQEFAVYRQIQNPIYKANVQVSSGDDEITINTNLKAGPFSSGLAVGDAVVFYDPTNAAGTISKRFTIISINLSTNKFRVTPTPTIFSGSYTAIVVREGFLTRYLLAQEDDRPYSATFATGSPLVVFDTASSDRDQLGFMRVGDQVIRMDDTASPAVPSHVFTVVRWDAATKTAYVTPSPGFSESSLVKIWRPSKPPTPFGGDILERMLEDSLMLTLTSKDPDLGGDGLTTATGSAVVQTVAGLNFNNMKIIPGDYLIVLEGPDSARDVGFGNGVFPIVALPSATQLQVTDTMLATQAAPGIQYGIRRIRPNE